jgi:hypothetical protein
MPANQRVPASRCPQGHASIAFLLPLGTICRCQTPFRGAILPSKPPGTWRMSANRSAAQTILSLIHQTLPRSLPCCDVPF